jgi:glycosyltransferase involved in cell wall biosynthesis
MKLLLVGPYPPPHGGISVHVASAHRLLERSGATCRVLDCGGHRERSTGAPARAAARVRLLQQVRSHAASGFTVHAHANGHSPRSWLLLLGCGLAAQRAPGRVLTLHSGLVPRFLRTASAGTRALVRLALRRYDRVLCANDAIRAAVEPLGRHGSRARTLPAYLSAPPAEVELPRDLERWLSGRRPLLCTALFFRPEYGFDLLVAAVERLRASHPSLGCLVLGGGDEAEPARERLRARGLERAVLLAGDVDHDSCLALMSRSDLFVRPTLADGDALSVREALALGVPVVASDAGHRPPGVVLFPCGDLEALVAALGAGLDRGRQAGPGAGDGDGADGFDRLLETYREVRES